MIRKRRKPASKPDNEFRRWLVVLAAGLIAAILSAQCQVNWRPQQQPLNLVK